MQQLRCALHGLVAIGLVAIGLVAAAPVGHAEYGATLAGSEWRPTQLGEMAIAETTPIFVRFQGDGRVTGHGGCNRFFGPYEFSLDGISIGPIGATRMICRAPLMAGEAALLAALQAAKRFHRDGVVLQLFDADAQEIARFAQTDWD